MKQMGCFFLRHAQLVGGVNDFRKDEGAIAVSVQQVKELVHAQAPHALFGSRHGLAVPVVAVVESVVAAVLVNILGCSHRGGGQSMKLKAEHLVNG